MGAFISLFPSFICFVISSTPISLSNKIKSQVFLLSVYVVGAHVCANHTPLLSCFTIAQQNQTRKVNIRCQKNLDEFQRKSKPGGSNQAGRPEIFEKFPKTPSLGVEQTEPEPVQKGHRGWPQAQAGRPLLGRPAPPVGHSPAPFACSRFATSTLYFFLVSCNFIENHAN